MHAPDPMTKYPTWTTTKGGNGGTEGEGGRRLNFGRPLKIRGKLEREGGVGGRRTNTGRPLQVKVNSKGEERQYRRGRGSANQFRPTVPNKVLVAKVGGGRRLNFRRLGPNLKGNFKRAIYFLLTNDL